MRILAIAFLIACAPGTAVTGEKVLDDDVSVDSGVQDTGDTDDIDDTDDTDDTEDTNDTDDTNTDPDDIDDDGDGFTENDGDCDDADPSVNPDARDTVDDGIDQDCSGADLSCESAVEDVWTVNFPATGTGSCDWGNAGNLEAVDRFVNARRAQEVMYSPPENSAICAIRPAIQSNQGGWSDTFVFDDAAMMVYNDYVLFSTNDELVAPLQNGSWNGKIYDWDLMKGLASIVGQVAWEWGNTSIDVDQNDGIITEIRVQNNKMNNLHDISIANNEIRFMLVTFGDNDNQGDGDGPDCYHEGLSFPVEIDIAQ